MWRELGGRLEVADTADQHVVDTVAGSGSTGYIDGDFLQSRFNSPGGVCVQTKGRKAGFPIIFITDQLNHRIRALHRDQVIDKNNHYHL